MPIHRFAAVGGAQRVLSVNPERVKIKFLNASAANYVTVAFFDEFADVINLMPGVVVEITDAEDVLRMWYAWETAPASPADLIIITDIRRD